MIFHRITFVDRRERICHEWFRSITAAGDRAKELHNLGMDDIDIEDEDVPMDNDAELCHWLNMNTNTPPDKESYYGR